MIKRKFKEEEFSLDELLNEDLREDHFLVLHNDDLNSFDFVIDTLIEVCDHTLEQAEQCAFLTHFKGKCDVKKGKKSTLQPLKVRLVKKGLSATIN